MLAVALLMTTFAIPPDMQRDLEAWRATQDQEMRGPHSPIAFLGMRPLKPGHNTVGSAADDTHRFESPGLPAHAFDLIADANSLHFSPNADGVRLNGQPALADAELKAGDVITVASVEVSCLSSATIAVTDRGRLQAYKGLHYLKTDPSYRVSATFESAEPGKSLSLETSQHLQKRLPLKGRLHFTLDGQELALDGFQLGDRPNDLFVIFKDATNGKETYGAGRFLWVKQPVDGKAIVDFNLAWNPLCAYSDGYNCPLAPPENRLSVRIPVGEGPYGHH